MLRVNLEKAQHLRLICLFHKKAAYEHLSYATFNLPLMTLIIDILAYFFLLIRPFNFINHTVNKKPNERKYHNND